MSTREQIMQLLGDDLDSFLQNYTYNDLSYGDVCEMMNNDEESDEVLEYLNNAYSDFFVDIATEFLNHHATKDGFFNVEVTVS